MSNLLGLEEERPYPAGYDDLPMGPDPELAATAKRGANWFYWIAALSLINSGAFMAGANFHFLAGLGITEIADGLVEFFIEQGAPSAFKMLAIVFDLAVVIGFALAGYYANKLLRTAFIAGIGVYFIDALIVLLLGDYFMAAFHAFALFGLVRGFLACRQIKVFNAASVNI